MPSGHKSCSDGQRLMQQDLLTSNHRQQVRPAKLARDRMRRCLRLCDRLAIPAGELLADVLDDLPSAAARFQRLRDHPHRACAAARCRTCHSARCRFDDTFDRQVSGNGTSSGRGFCVRCWRLTRSRPWCPARPGLSRSSDGELKAVDQQLPRSEVPNCFAPALASISFSRSIFQATDGHFAPRQHSCSRCARITRCAAANGRGSGSKRPHDDHQSYSPLKIAADSVVIKQVTA